MSQSTPTPDTTARTDTADALTFTYTNWRGETDVRFVDAAGAYFHFGATEWHGEPQWLLRAHDRTKAAFRDFAVRDIRFASPQHPVGVREALEEALDLLQERRYGSSARSPGHNAQLAIKRALGLLASPVTHDANSLAARFAYLSERIATVTTLPTPGDLYYPIKNDGAGTGWRYTVSYVTAEDIHKAARAFATLSHPPAQDAPGAVTLWECRSKTLGVETLWTSDENAAESRASSGRWDVTKRAMFPSPPLPEADGEIVAKLDAILAKQPVAGNPDGESGNWGLHNDWRGWWKKLFMPAVAEFRAALVSALRERDEAYRRENDLAADVASQAMDLALERAAREKAEQVAAGLREEGEERGFAHGYLIAVANLINLHDEPGMGADVISESGLTLSDAKALGLSDYDLAAFEKMRPDAHRVGKFFSARKSKFAALRASTEEGKTATPSVKDEEAGRG